MKFRFQRWLIAAIILAITILLAMQSWSLRVGMHRFNVGDYSGAAPYLKIARVLNPFTQSVPGALSEIYISEKQFDRAEKILDSLLSKNPNVPKFHNLQGVVYQSKDRLDAALKEFQKAVELDPKYGIAHLNLGYLLLKTGKTQEGLKELKLSLSLDPNLDPNIREILRRFNIEFPAAPAPASPGNDINNK